MGTQLCSDRETGMEKPAYRLVEKLGLVEKLDPIDRWMFALWLPMALFCTSGLALDSNRQISQYAHTAWRVQDGAFSGTPHAITQTTDGYLWIGTENGLVRFDGVRFVPWTPPNGKRLPTSRVDSLLGASDGSLWIGTGVGLVHSSKEDLVDYSSSARAFVETILEDPSGTIWMTRSRVGSDARGPLCKVIGKELQCYGASSGIPFQFSQPLARDNLGNLWMGSDLGLARWKSGSASSYLPEALKRGKDLSGVTAIAAEADGTLWVGTARSGPGLGLQRLIDGVLKPYSVPGMDAAALEVSALLKGRNNELWVGTKNQGIYRVRDGKADHFRAADGLSSDAVSSFFQDREDDLWVVTSRGIDRFHENAVVSFSIREGLTAEDVGSVMASRDGTVWIANTLGLNVFRDGRLSAITQHDGLPGRLVTSLFEDHAGRLWIGIDSGLTTYEGGRFRPVNKANGSPLGVVIAITEDIDHDIWVEVAQRALFRIPNVQAGDSHVTEEFDPPKIPRALSLAADPGGGIWLGLADGNLARYQQGKLETFSTGHGSNYAIQNILLNPDGSLWAATGAGLIGWKQGKLNTVNSRNGLPCDSIFAAVKDDKGFLWLAAECGFVEIDNSELEKWWEHPDTTVKVRVFDVFDGAQPALANFRPEASRSVDGKLWFANGAILQMIDPSHLQENHAPPPVHVEDVVADQKRYSAQTGLRIPALTRNIEINYTALSFVVPEKVRFRYKLEGHDENWQDPGMRRQAFYNDLRPGKYRFHVIACNNDGLWNEAGATLDFAVRPAFFQTVWFWALCCITTVGVLWLMYARRVRQLAGQMQTRLEERLEEREAIARDLHDTLLQGFSSAAMQLDVANDRLPEDSPAKPIVRRVIELMNQIGQEGRRTILSLRSPLRASHDLEQALSQIQKEFPDAEKVDFSVVVEGTPRLLNPIVWDEVYRLGREAIINSFRHSGAKKITVEIEYTGRNMRLSVRDNGCGLDAHVLEMGREGHWGLSGMRERAEKIGAELVVLSRPGAGTEVAVSIPGSLAFEVVPSDRLPKWLARFFRTKNGTNGPIIR
jgi:signal transduction histidine kinase/ligand-binding sensor domain-containing protein